MIQFVTRAQVRQMIRDILEPDFGPVEFSAEREEEGERADESVLTEGPVIELGDGDIIHEDDHSVTLNVLDRLDRVRR